MLARPGNEPVTPARRWLLGLQMLSDAAWRLMAVPWRLPGELCLNTGVIHILCVSSNVMPHDAQCSHWLKASNPGCVRTIPPRLRRLRQHLSDDHLFNNARITARTSARDGDVQIAWLNVRRCCARIRPHCATRRLRSSEGDIGRGLWL
ncbi:uncharacterized protein PHACADRAFT_261907, partial [Phanerochaete carnosa HHB-10118-sp]